MTHQERDRLGVSLVLALAIHAVILVAIVFTDWEIREYPRSNVVIVELPDYSSAPIVEPDPPEAEPVEPDPPEVTPDEPPTADLAPVGPASVTESIQAASTQSSTDAPPGRFALDDDPQLAIGQSTDREDARTSDADLFSYDEVSESGELPSWVAEGTIQPLTTLAIADQISLEQKEDTVPGFQNRLDEILRALENPESVSTSTGPESQQTTETTELPDEIDVDWGEGGSRSPMGLLARPFFDGTEFGSLVPARIVYVIVFDVNSDGLVVPGSLIWRQSSGYTPADERVRDAVRSWFFEPAPGSPVVTAISTIILEREDLN